MGPDKLHLTYSVCEDPKGSEDLRNTASVFFLCFRKEMRGADCRRGSKIITALLVYLERLGGEKSFMKLPLPFLGFYVCLNIRRYYTAFLGGSWAVLNRHDNTISFILQVE